MTTVKQYHLEPFLYKVNAQVKKIVAKGLILDKTISFAEGGGQIGDSGTIINQKTKKQYHYTDTTKVPGRVLHLSDFPTITVENDIIHHIESQYLTEFEVGDHCEIVLDLEKRQNISFNHTAIHIALMAAEKIRPQLRKSIYGAKINDSYGRLDFKLGSRFSVDEMEKINEYANEIIKKELDIKIFAHLEEEEALYWECGDFVIPCGGTHAINTKQLGEIIVRRKNIGKNADRLIATFNLEEIPLDMYYEQSNI